jgi:hypothetical protein
MVDGGPTFGPEPPSLQDDTRNETITAEKITERTPPSRVELLFDEVLPAVLGEFP